MKKRNPHLLKTGKVRACWRDMLDWKNRPKRDRARFSRRSWPFAMAISPHGCPRTGPASTGASPKRSIKPLCREESIAREVRRLSVTVGKEGRLKQRMSLPGAVGDWAVKADSINTSDRRPGAAHCRRRPHDRRGGQRRSRASPWIWRSTDGALEGGVPPLGEAGQHDDRAALGLHLGGHARGARGRHRGQAGRPGTGAGRVGRVERPHRIGQPDGRQPHRAGSQYRRGDHRRRRRRPVEEDHRRRARRDSCSSRKPSTRWWTSSGHSRRR